ncbi:MAG TPA: hypothetical protein VFM80_09215 [Gracilimonas sp.]|uniref:hypothetical protein n=1 Tax=Gracilimonas sp. TaxID=1974203 RepID=UPI002D96D197|nr:hypothetical protein [Gracilimonas sp.]
MKGLKRTVLLMVFGFFVIGISSCSLLSNDDGKSYFQSVNNDLESLNQRVQIINNDIVLDSLKSKFSSTSSTLGGDKFTHIANVESPEVNGKKLSATSIEIRANKVYISYHLNGSEYAGAVDIIDINDEENPKIISSLISEDTDINALEIEENAKILWITGGRDVGSSGYSLQGHGGAILGEKEIEKGVFKTGSGSYREIPLPSFSGNDIVDFAQDLYVVSGATGGGFYQLNKGNLSITKRVDNNFAKSIDRRQDDVIGLNLLADKRANFTIMDFKSDAITTFQTPFAVTPVDGKNVLEHTAAITYVALGNRGVKGYKFSTSADTPVYEFNAHGADVANGVTVDGKYVYIANGTDGLFITTLPRDGKTEPEEVYSWKSNSTNTASANFVKTNGQYIILANGVDGLNILKISGS